jgi:hypothetical protein
MNIYSEINLPIAHDYGNFALDAYAKRGSNIPLHEVFAGTLFDASKDTIDVSFWLKEREILMALKLFKTYKEKKDELDPDETLRLYVFAIQIILKNLGFADKDKPSWEFHKNFAEVYHILTDITKTLSFEFLHYLDMAIIEQLEEYTNPKMKNNRKYIISMHRYKRPDIIYMTMSIRIHKDEEGYFLEHRHISQSVAGLVRPPIARILSFDEEFYGTHPSGLSMLMHKVSLIWMNEFHPEIQRLHIQPLISMYKILAAKGFVEPLHKDDKRKSIEVYFNKKQLHELRDYDAWKDVKFNKGIRLLKQCISCFENPVEHMCSKCHEALVCLEIECNKNIIHNCEFFNKKK